jgi:glycosyltransferase involved in cell wall biosynthesis
MQPYIRIAVSVIGSMANFDGTTVRAREIIDIFSRNAEYDLIVITRARSKNQFFHFFDRKKFLTRLVEPERTKLWNLKLIPIVLNNRFNFVYCVADIFGFLTYYVLSKVLKFKIIFESHALVHKEKAQLSKVKSLLYFLLELFIGKKANTVIALSGESFRFFKRLNENTFLIPVFVDEKLFHDTRSHNNGKHKNPIKIIGLVGPFDILANSYQLDFLYTNIDKFTENIQFLIIGRCSRRIAVDKVKYTGYLESKQDYAKTIRELDALMVPTRLATFGPQNKILEAMACSIPVFTTPQGLIGLDFARPSENIFVYEETELVEKVNELVLDEILLKKIGENARETVERFYSKSLCKKKMLNILKGILRNDY